MDEIFYIIRMVCWIKRIRRLGINVLLDDDIEKEFKKLISNGAQKLNEPVSLTPERKACYLQDPDGNWVELIEDNS